MALIHIDPVPLRCSPGAVLAFVCDKTALDGKKVGKIAFVGRGATVEVPDAKAAAIVSALDGATFNDKPVRVRFAGKGDFTDSDHFGKLSALLDLEARAEQEEARRRAQAEEGSALGDGSTLTKRVLRDSEFGRRSASRSTRRTMNCPTRRCGASTCRRTRCRGCGSRTRCAAPRPRAATGWRNCGTCCWGERGNLPPRPPSLKGRGSQTSTFRSRRRRARVLSPLFPSGRGGRGG